MQFKNYFLLEIFSDEINIDNNVFIKHLLFINLTSVPSKNMGILVLDFWRYK